MGMLKSWELSKNLVKVFCASTLVIIFMILFAQYVSAATIAGTIYPAALGAGSGKVEAYKLNTANGKFEYSQASPLYSGGYELLFVPVGTYKINFQIGGGFFKWYSDKIGSDEADIVQVTSSGQTITINATIDYKSTTDEYGDTCAMAAPLVLNSWIRGVLDTDDTSNDLDFFKIDIPSNGTLTITGERAVEYFITLYDSDCTQLQQVYWGTPSGYSFCNTLVRDLPPGTYYISLDSSVYSNMQYALKADFITTYYRDSDNDNYGNTAVTTQAYSKPTGYVLDNTDCNDNNASVHPGVTEACNGIDDNCNDQIDEGCPTTTTTSIPSTTTTTILTTTTSLATTSTTSVQPTTTSISTTSSSTTTSQPTTTTTIPTTTTTQSTTTTTIMTTSSSSTSSSTTTTIPITTTTVVSTTTSVISSTTTTWIDFVKVPQTGQTKCYNEAGDNITCSGTGQDGEIQAGKIWPNPRFDDLKDGTIIDLLTGLVWMKNANLLGTDNADNDTDETIGDGKVTWQHALEYIKNLNTENYLGHSDWRLPNINELESLVDAQFNDPAFPQLQPFTNLQSRYWSSTTYLFHNSSINPSAWVIYISWGMLGRSDKFYPSCYVWPIRAQCDDNSTICLPKTGQTICYNDNGTIIDCTDTGQDGDLLTGVTWPDPRFTVDDDTVTDNLTGLMWAKNANLMATRDPSYDADFISEDGSVTWQHALDYVAKLNNEKYLSFSDWRLPNRKELRSLADYENYNPVLPTEHPFTNVQFFGSKYYWTSTSKAFYTDSAWVVDIWDGAGGGFYTKTGGIGTYFFVWPVRTTQGDNSTITTTTAISTSTITTSVTSTSSSSLSSSSSTSTVSTASSTTSSSTSSTTTTIETPCAVKLFPASISKLGSLIMPIKFFIISGGKSAALTKDTAVVWDTKSIETINKFELGRQKKILLVQVLIKSQLLEASELYTVNAGGCFGTLKVRTF